MYERRKLQLKKLNKNKIIKNQIIECEVSKASTEIMLYRVFNGSKVDFPFCN